MFVGKFYGVVITHLQFNSLHKRTGTDNGQCLWKYIFIHKKDISSGFHLVAAAQIVGHSSCFGGSGGFVEERCIGQRQSGKIDNRGLKV